MLVGVLFAPQREQSALFGGRHGKVKVRWKKKSEASESRLSVCVCVFLFFCFGKAHVARLQFFLGQMYRNNRG